MDIELIGNLYRVIVIKIILIAFILINLVLINFDRRLLFLKVLVAGVCYKTRYINRYSIISSTIYPFSACFLALINY